MKKNIQKKLFKQISGKKQQKVSQKIIEEGKKFSTRAELAAVQNSLLVRTDLALMENAALAEILVKAKLCTYSEIKEGEKRMFEVLKLVRKAMNDAVTVLGNKATTEDIGSYAYEQAVAAGTDKDLLTELFGIRPTKSRIIKPGVNNGIIVQK